MHRGIRKFDYVKQLQTRIRLYGTAKDLAMWLTVCPSLCQPLPLPQPSSLIVFQPQPSTSFSITSSCLKFANMRILERLCLFSFFISGGWKLRFQSSLNSLIPCPTGCGFQNNHRYGFHGHLYSISMACSYLDSETIHDSKSILCCYQYSVL